MFKKLMEKFETWEESVYQSKSKMIFWIFATLAYFYIVIWFIEVIRS